MGKREKIRGRGTVGHAYNFSSNVTSFIQKCRLHPSLPAASTSITHSLGLYTNVESLEIALI